MCKIVSLTSGGDKKRIDVSIDPSKVYSHIKSSSVTPGTCLNGAVLSKEDHGYIIDLGIDSLAGFLKNEHFQDKNISVGTIVRCTVLKVNKKVAQLSSMDDKLSVAVFPSSSVIEMDQVIAGNAINGKISSISGNQLLESIMLTSRYWFESVNIGYFRGDSRIFAFRINEIKRNIQS